MIPKFSTLIITKPEDFHRLQHLYPRLLKNLPSDRLIFISSSPIKEHIKEVCLEEQTGFIDENDILPFSEVHAVLERHMKGILGDDELPRGATGWYYQQFLKMLYAFHCPDEYYLVWDGDTIPCVPFSMFQDGSNAPYFDLKSEYHEEYFITLEKLLPGMKKCIKKSFISEHMLFHTETMKQLIQAIEANDALAGSTFWEKILLSIPPTKIANSAFSEFETYGTFVAYTNPDLYKLREWHSFRLAGEFFDPLTICERDFTWLGKDFQAISFEKGQSVREDNKNLFDNPEYQSKLSARKMLEIAQEEFNGGYIEVWGDTEDFLFSDPLATGKSQSRQIQMEEWEFYEHLGDSYLYTNYDKAYLCYENAEFLATESAPKKILKEKMSKLKDSGKLMLRKASIAIVSYNNKAVLQQCIWSIQEHCAPDSYNIIIADNASTDGVTKWLENLPEDITVILSDVNLGFPGGCNLCIRYADPNSDIFLLNNDTRMTHNALFWLRMGLYEHNSIGATGCISNFAGNEQSVPVSFSRPEEYVSLGKKINIPLANPLEEKSRLCGFAMLIRRDVLNQIGNLDENFAPGYFEDDDLCLRIRKLGYKLMVCHNSFIYHIGSKSFQENPEVDKLIYRNYNLIKEKWGFDCLNKVFTKSQKEVLDKICREQTGAFRLLEIGCEFGNFLSMLHYRLPQGQFFGIESEPMCAKYGVTQLPILTLNWLKDTLPYPSEYFDYILLNPKEQNGLSESEIKKIISPYLKLAGKLILTKEDF